MFKYLINIPVLLIQRFQTSAARFRVFLKRPLRSDVLSFKGLILASVVALLAVAFFNFTELFEVGVYKASSRGLYIALVAGAAFTGILVTDFLLALLFGRFFDKENWTVSREVALNVLRVFFAGLFVMVLANQTGLARFDLPLVLLKFTVIGILPAFVLAMLKESVLRNKYTTHAEAINDRIKIVKPGESRGLQVLVFKGSNDGISIVPNQLISLEIDKYQSHFSFQNLFGTVEKSLDILQENVWAEIKKHDQFYEAARGIYVNKLAIHKTSADASGLRLHVAKKSQPVRVEPRFESGLLEL